MKISPTYKVTGGPLNLNGYTTLRSTGVNPLFPASGPATDSFYGLPAKSKFLAAESPQVGPGHPK